MRRLALLVAVAVLACTGSAQAARLVTWKTTKSKFVDPKTAQFNNVPSEAPAKPSALPVNVLLPDGYSPHKRYPVLYLLHGHGDSYWSWFSSANGNVTQVARGFPGIIVMPEAGQGWYTDWWNGGRRGAPGWESYHLRELIPLVERRLPIRRGRRWHAVAGLSMGGEATMYYASQRPGYFGSAAAFSPPLSIQRTEWPAGFNTQGQDFTTVFGDVGGFYATGHNPLKLVDNLRWTRLFVGVGDGSPGSPDDVSNGFGQAAERELRMHADDFVPAARAAGADVTYEVHAGVHDWPYWRTFLSDAITWGFFRPVRTSPSKWTYKTVMRRGEAWGYSFVFAAPPGEVETFSRAGGRLRAAGSGRVTVRGPGGCTFVAKVPFDRPICRAKRSH
ncbi:MAG: diacylglycerol O-acyltransferase / trehalose O-mycolyltransferase [Thermoleophilaceae bacterium]|jgi:S-formylglutathione hydrolase FrmB|nr:diacylglycerol O-acyltransferase / trehalose O-mycolyltransferase [Thermoleophilaceae bacterium]MEA2470508.1 diacylglycerol O-acyltransferase / trehalose O-mycolyltransferase [Thermoleophilaceae bacterium]